jgi:hypothetical protein
MNKLQEEIARVAYELYEKRGRGDGCHVDDWVQAEKIVLARHAQVAEKAGKPAKAVKKAAGRSLKEKEAVTAGKAAPKKRATARKTTTKKTT